jgi:hypothetical protein
MGEKSKVGAFNWAAFLQIAMQILAMILAILPAQPTAAGGKKKNQPTTSAKSDAA